MAVQVLTFDGVEVFVEVDEIQSVDEVPTEARRGFDRGGLRGEGTSTSSLVDSASRLRATVGAVVAPVAQALASVGPEEWAVELSLGFKGGAGVPFLVNGEANGSVKVSAKWKRATDEATSRLP